MPTAVTWNSILTTVRINKERVTVKTPAKMFVADLNLTLHNLQLEKEATVDDLTRVIQSLFYGSYPPTLSARYNDLQQNIYEKWLRLLSKDSGIFVRSFVKSAIVAADLFFSTDTDIARSYQRIYLDILEHVLASRWHSDFRNSPFDYNTLFLSLEKHFIGFYTRRGQLEYNQIPTTLSTIVKKIADFQKNQQNREELSLTIALLRAFSECTPTHRDPDIGEFYTHCASAFDIFKNFLNDKKAQWQFSFFVELCLFISVAHPSHIPSSDELEFKASLQQSIKKCIEHGVETDMVLQPTIRHPKIFLRYLLGLIYDYQPSFRSERIKQPLEQREIPKTIGHLLTQHITAYLEGNYTLFLQRDKDSSEELEEQIFVQLMYSTWQHCFDWNFDLLETYNTALRDLADENIEKDFFKSFFNKNNKKHTFKEQSPYYFLWMQSFDSLKEKTVPFVDRDGKTLLSSTPQAVTAVYFALTTPLQPSLFERKDCFSMTHQTPELYYSIHHPFHRFRPRDSVPDRSERVFWWTSEFLALDPLRAAFQTLYQHPVYYFIKPTTEVALSAARFDGPWFPQVDNSVTAGSLTVLKTLLPRRFEKITHLPLRNQKSELLEQLALFFPNTTHLKLLDCQLENTKFLEKLQGKITHLRISYSKLRAIEQEIVKCTSLKILHLANNALSNITQLQKSKLTTLEKLDLSSNKIEDGDFSMLSALRQLNLSHNTLQRFPTLPPTIEWVCLSHNPTLSNSDLKIAPPYPRKIQLQHCALKKIPQLVASGTIFPNYGAHTLLLDLYGNKIDSLQDANFDLSHYVTIDIRHNSLKMGTIVKIARLLHCIDYAGPVFRTDTTESYYYNEYSLEKTIENLIGEQTIEKELNLRIEDCIKLLSEKEQETLKKWLERIYNYYQPQPEEIQKKIKGNLTKWLMRVFGERIHLQKNETTETPNSFAWNFFKTLEMHAHIALEAAEAAMYTIDIFYKKFDTAHEKNLNAIFEAFIFRFIAKAVFQNLKHYPSVEPRDTYCCFLDWVLEKLQLKQYGAFTLSTELNPISDMQAHHLATEIAENLSRNIADCIDDGRDPAWRDILTAVTPEAARLAYFQETGNLEAAFNYSCHDLIEDYRKDNSKLGNFTPLFLLENEHFSSTLLEKVTHFFQKSPPVVPPEIEPPLYFDPEKDSFRTLPPVCTQIATLIDNERFEYSTTSGFAKAWKTITSQFISASFLQEQQNKFKQIHDTLKQHPSPAPRSHDTLYFYKQHAPPHLFQSFIEQYEALSMQQVDRKWSLPKLRQQLIEHLPTYFLQMLYAVDTLQEDSIPSILRKLHDYHRTAIVTMSPPQHTPIDIAESLCTPYLIITLPYEDYTRTGFSNFTKIQKFITRNFLFFSDSIEAKKSFPSEIFDKVYSALNTEVLRRYKELTQCYAVVANYFQEDSAQDDSRLREIFHPQSILDSMQSHLTPLDHSGAEISTPHALCIHAIKTIYQYEYTSKFFDVTQLDIDAAELQSWTYELLPRNWKERWHALREDWKLAVDTPMFQPLLDKLKSMEQ